MIKQQTEMTELRNLLGKNRNLMEGLTSRIITAEDRISEFEDEVQKITEN